MSFIRYAAPALTAISMVAAQSTTNSCSASATVTIQNGGDAAALAACTTFTGSIALATGTTANIALDGIQEIQGSLYANNVTQLSQLSAGSLETITDKFYLNGLVTLVALTFPVLNEVGDIEWEALPNLQGLAFGDEGVQKVNTLNIQNTKLNSLDGIDLTMADSITVTNNPYLKSIKMQLGNVTEALTISANGQDLDVELTNLIWANNMTLINCSSVSVPSLASINGSLGFYSSYFQNVSAPNLTTVGGSMSLNMNDNLVNVSMPELTTVGGGLKLAQNPSLLAINGFPSLKTVGGAILFSGAFTDVELPDLSQVRGGVNLTSSGDISAACSHFKPLSGTTSSIIEGPLTCNSLVGNSTSSGKPSSTSGTSGGSSTPTGSKNSAGGLLVPSVTGVLGVVAAIFGML